MIHSPPVEEGRVYTARARGEKQITEALWSNVNTTPHKETHIKRSSKSVNRQLALSESAKNKQTFEFTNRGISSLLTLVRLQWRISFFVGVFFLPCSTLKWGVASSQRCSMSSDMCCRALQHLSLETAPQMIEMEQLPIHQAAPRKRCVTGERVCCRSKRFITKAPPL